MYENDADFIALANSKGDDSSCIARFFLKPKYMRKKSEEEGREIYEDREYIEIRVKGQDKQIFCREATDEDRHRFPSSYLAFKRGTEVPVTGTPIEQLGNLGPSLVHKLRGLGIRTIEDMANITDEHLFDVGPGARDLKNRAQSFLDKTTVTVTELEKQLEEQKARNDDLEDRLKALETSKPRKKRTKKRAAA